MFVCLELICDGVIFERRGINERKGRKNGGTKYGVNGVGGNAPIKKTMRKKSR